MVRLLTDYHKDGQGEMSGMERVYGPTHPLLAQVIVVAFLLACCSELCVGGWQEGGWRSQTPHPPLMVSSVSSWSSSSREGVGRKS